MEINLCRLPVIGWKTGHKELLKDGTDSMKSIESYFNEATLFS